MRTETDVQNLARVLIAQYGGVAWRNNTGVAREIDEDTGRMRPIRYGLGNDSAKLNAAFKMGDLVGMDAHGLFCMWECKRPGWRYTGTDTEVAQWTAIKFVRAHGGRAGFVNHPDQAVAIMQGTGQGAYTA